MSIINDGRAVCTKCGQSNIIKVYKSINTADSPELRDKVKDGSLFLWECPHCGQVNLARYDTLYHDPERSRQSQTIRRRWAATLSALWTIWADLWRKC